MANNHCVSDWETCGAEMAKPTKNISWQIEYYSEMIVINNAGVDLVEIIKLFTCILYRIFGVF